MSEKEQEKGAFYRTWALNHWQLVNRLAQRRFASDILAEEAALYVMTQLEKNDWQVLRNYRGTARLQTFFSSVVYNQLEDFARTRFGRVRPPLWLRKLGGIWLLLYRLLCLERYSYVDATNRAADSYEQMQFNQIELMADRILGEISSCGKAQYHQESIDEQELADSRDLVSGQDIAEEKERKLFLAALHDYFFGNEPDTQKMEALTRLTGSPVELKPEERVLLKLCHVEGFSVAEAGRKLGLSRFQVHGKMRRLYKRIRQSFEEGGCGAEIRLLLEEDTDTKQ